MFVLQAPNQMNVEILFMSTVFLQIKDIKDLVQNMGFTPKGCLEQFSLTYMFISHDLSVMRFIAHRVGVMYLGRLVELAATNELFEKPLHPYTKALMSAIPVPDPEAKIERIVLSGDVPNPQTPPPGCTFHTRCPIAKDVCKTKLPEWREINTGRFVACHFVDGEFYDG